jgi:tetratricopeptide (TPR) repeat protein
LPLSGASFLVKQLAGLGALDRSRADDLQATLKGVRDGEASDYAAGVSATNESAVAFAVLRRISRESVHIADPIERVARELATALAAVHTDKGVVTLDEVDLTDRLSLKLYTRLFLRLDYQYPTVSWQWRFASDAATSPGTLLSTRARHLLFERIAGVLQPTADLDGGLPPHDGGRSAGPSSVLDLSNNVVLQNYDYCLQPPAVEPSDAEEASDRARLVAIALVNVGEPEEALQHLDLAARLTERPAKRATAHYLASLVYQKRLHRPDAGMWSLDQAERALRNAPQEADVRVETAWCCNGRALHEVLQWRASRGADHIEEAVRLVTEAFWAIDGLDEPAAVYLRNNLLANMAFLFEMTGDVRQSLTMFESMFLDSVDLTDGVPSRYKTTLCYRVGLLAAKAGDHERGMELLSCAQESASALGSWFSLERVLRGAGWAFGVSGVRAEALAAHEQGLALSDELGSSEGFAFHADSLTAFRNATSGPKPSPKLPAYFPEFDLEDAPRVRLNDHLAGGALT